MKHPEKVSRQIINWINTYLENSKMNGLVVGVSGGGDSTSLLIALSEIKKIIPKIYFEAFHVNYGLRIESNNDEEFVKKIWSKPFGNISATRLASSKDFG